jgi:hypothetical protein
MVPHNLNCWPASLMYRHKQIMFMPVPEPMTAFTASDDPVTGQSNVVEPVLDQVWYHTI